MEAFGLYGHIRSNRRRSLAMLFGLFLLAYAVSYAVILIALGAGGGPGARGLLYDPLGYANRVFVGAFPFVTLGVALWIFIGYKANVAMIAAATGAEGLTREAAPKLYKLIEPLCISRGMSVPRLMVVESPALNAFASGVNDKQYTVTVTRGLLDELTDAELEAVLAHELTHIRNDDVKMMIVAVVIAGVISFVGELVFRSRLRFSGSSGGDRKGGGALILIGVAIIVVSWLLALFLRFALSRSREYLADAGAVELTKNPDALISALLKIAGRADIEGVPSGVMDMCIENDPDDWGDLFSTHPSIAKRIQALASKAGGREPSAAVIAPPRVGERTALPMEAERRGPWGRPPAPQE